MQGLLQVIGFVGFLAMGLVQIFATVDGVQHLTGLGSFLSWVIGLFVGWSPLIGTALGIYGAHSVWGWSWLWSLMLFVGIPLVLFGVVSLVGGMAEMAGRMRHRKSS